MKHIHFLLLSFCLIFFSCTGKSGKTFFLHTNISKHGRYFGADDISIQYSGRIDFSKPGKAVFSLPGIKIRFCFTGTKVAVNLKDHTTGGIQADGSSARNFFNVYIDGNDPFVLELVPDDTIYTLISGLKREKHYVTLIKRTEALAGKVEFRGLWLEKNQLLLPVPEKSLRKIEFVGNSITCGYGVEASSENEPSSCTTENVCLSYAFLTAENLNADYHIVAWSGKGVAQNYDRSQTNTMPEIWKRLFPDEAESVWDHSWFVPDVVVINLGTNDFSFEDVDTALFRAEYINFIREIRKVYPESGVVFALGPMVNNTYPKNALNTIRYLIQSIKEQLHHEGDENIHYFELSSQDGQLGYGADWHPSIAQQQKNSVELIGYIRTITGWK